MKKITLKRKPKAKVTLKIKAKPKRTGKYA